MVNNFISIVRLLVPLLLLVIPFSGASQLRGTQCDDCDNDCLHIAVKSNLIHDALLTPDFGVELALPRNFSVGVEGIYAWWSNDKAHRYWRIRGAWLDANYWFGAAVRRRVLTGHHIGIYGSAHDYDFEFGGKGWQSRRPTFGVGATYGYSFCLNDRMNIDLAVRVGYAGGNVTAYRPECGRYVCVDRYYKHYVGVTGLAVTLVWFPGRGNFNNPKK